MLSQIGEIIIKSSVITNRLSITMAALIIDYVLAPISQPYLFVFFSSIKFFVTYFSASMRAKVFKFCIYQLRFEVYCLKENNNAEIYFAFFSFFPFFSSLTPCQRFLRNDCTCTLKFGTHIGYNYLYHVRQNQRPHIYHSLYLSIFLFLHYFFFFCQRFLRNYCT